MSIASHTEPRVLLTDLSFPESPRWRDGHLFVPDWGANEIIASDLAGGRAILARPTSLTCIDHLPDGRLLIVAPGDRSLLRLEPDGSLVTHAELGPFEPQHPWNDIVVDGRGNAYVNNIGFDFPAGEFAPGIVVLVTPDGSVRQVADGLAFPNGMTVTPDNATLIIAESYGQKLTAFDVAADGGLSNRRTWAQVVDHPDGICLDAEGAVWYADVASQRCVRVREGGQVMQVIELDRGCFACALGGPDRKTLFVVANEWSEAMLTGDASPKGQVLAVEAPAPGAGWP